MLKRNLFYVFIVMAVAGLVIVSLTSVEKDNAIVAVVESQKTAISYQKPVSVKAIHVIAGQQVKAGDLLIEVDRPDLNFDYEKLLNQKKQEEANLVGLRGQYRSDLELIDIESAGKVNRINAEIAQLETEIAIKNALRSDLESISTNANGQNSVADPDSILLESYVREKSQIEAHYSSEKRRLKAALAQDIELIELKLKLIEDEIKLLDRERSQLKKFAPFNGTIGNVNAQLNEIVPSFETIVSLYDSHPSTLKAFISSDSRFILKPGDDVRVESTNREYSIPGKVIEVGARIVGYKDPADPVAAPERYGREIFISLPPENQFLYGEQVLVFPSTN